MTIKSVCIFCGSGAGGKPEFAEAAREMGRTIARRGLSLIYGAGSIGLMGVAADAALAAKGKVFGVIPRSLWVREVGHCRLSSLLIVDTMHERKARMAEMADAFIAMPGGLGTLEEIFEIWTWAQLDIHHKPFGFLNVDGYFDPLFAALDSMANSGFIRPEHRNMPLVSDDPERLLLSFSTYKPPDIDKWWEEDAPCASAVSEKNP